MLLKLDAFNRLSLVRRAKMKGLRWLKAPCGLAWKVVDFNAVGLLIE